jgi:hypothetical protein
MRARPSIFRAPRRAALLGTLVFGALAASSAAEAQPRWQGAPSGRASTKVTFTAVVPQGTPPAQRPAPLTVTIDYGQPHARGREIAGGLIPNGEVWRLGANEATALTSTVDLEIGGLLVPKGSYTLFALATPTSMQLIVNRKTGQWGTAYEAGEDLVRIPMQLTPRAESVDALQISLEPAGDTAPLAGALRVRWGTVDATVGYTARP